MKPYCKACWGPARRQYIPAWGETVIYCITESCIITGDEVGWREMSL